MAGTLRSILMIRPIVQGRAFAERLRERSGNRLRILFSPLVAIEEVPSAFDLEGRQGILFTSPNAVAAFAGRTADRTLEALCVGPGTHEAARAAGFPAVRNEESPGSVTGLAELAAKRSGASGRPFLYPRGERVAHDLAGRLARRGVSVESVILYRQAPLPLTEEARAALVSGPLCVPVFSAYGASRLAREVGDAAPANLVCPCISEQAARPLAALRNAAVAVSAAPDGDAMQDLILKTARLE